MLSYPAFYPPLRDGQYRRTGTSPWWAFLRGDAYVNPFLSLLRRTDGPDPPPGESMQMHPAGIRIKQASGKSQSFDYGQLGAVYVSHTELMSANRRDCLTYCTLELRVAGEVYLQYIQGGRDLQQELIDNLRRWAERRPVYDTDEARALPARLRDRYSRIVHTVYALVPTAAPANYLVRADDPHAERSLRPSWNPDVPLLHPQAGECTVYENEHLPCPIWWRGDLPVPYTAGIGTTEFSPRGILLRRPDSLPQLIDQHVLSDLTLYAFSLNREDAHILLTCWVETIEQQCTFAADPDTLSLCFDLRRWWGIDFTAALVPGHWQGWRATAHRLQRRL